MTEKNEKLIKTAIEISKTSAIAFDEVFWSLEHLSELDKAIEGLEAQCQEYKDIVEVLKNGINKCVIANTYAPMVNNELNKTLVKVREMEEGKTNE